MSTTARALAVTLLFFLLVGCSGSPGAVSEGAVSDEAAAETAEREEAEREEAEREEEAAAKAAAQTAAQQQLHDECAATSKNLNAKLTNLDSRLSVGLPFADYSQAVGDAKVAYDRMFKSMEQQSNPDDLQCLTKVLVPLEAALNAYTTAYNTWNDCISDLYCEMEGDTLTKAQKSWTRATNQIAKADRALTNLQPAA